jgi:hypothetical protein
MGVVQCILGRMTKQTREKWAALVREWRESGLAAEAFAEGKDFEASTLRSAESQLKRERTSTNVAVAPRFLPVRVASQPVGGPELVVEVGGARIRVVRGADLALVGDLVRVLQGAAR